MQEVDAIRNCAAVHNNIVREIIIAVTGLATSYTLSVCGSVHNVVRAIGSKEIIEIIL